MFLHVPIGTLPLSDGSSDLCACALGRESVRSGVDEDELNNRQHGDEEAPMDVEFETVPAMTCQLEKIHRSPTHNSRNYLKDLFTPREDNDGMDFFFFFFIVGLTFACI